MATTKAKKVEKNFMGADYVCAKCGAGGVKLWRDSNTFLDHLGLFCVECAMEQQCQPGVSSFGKSRRKDDVFTFEDGDQIGWLLPAVSTPDGSTFWGYSSVPSDGILWWYGLPTYKDEAREVATLRVLVERHKNNYEYRYKDWIKLLGEALEISNKLKMDVPLDLTSSAMAGATAGPVAVAATLGKLEPTIETLLRVLTLENRICEAWLRGHEAISDMRWKFKRRLLEFTAEHTITIYGSKFHKDEEGPGGWWVPEEQARTVKPGDRIACTTNDWGDTRALLLDPENDTIKRAWTIMDYEQDGNRLIKALFKAGVVREVRQ